LTLDDVQTLHGGHGRKCPISCAFSLNWHRFVYSRGQPTHLFRWIRWISYSTFAFGCHTNGW
jgi:hypothetical protein